jgi:hypothetical protein
VTFEARVIAFSRRFLTNRTFELIVEPALADLQFDAEASGTARAASYLAVLRAVAGGLVDDLTRDSASFVLLALLPAGYYTGLMVVFADFFSGASRYMTTVAVALIVVLSLGPVTACFWPERHRAAAD